MCSGATWPGFPGFPGPIDFFLCLRILKMGMIVVTTSLSCCDHCSCKLSNASFILIMEQLCGVDNENLIQLA